MYRFRPNATSCLIHSYIGKLLAEYNSTGACQKDYIYMGSKLLAEYYPSTAKTYYYTSDQINSTRIITDSTGTVVYSAMFDPYGGMQKQWVNTYQPSLKFSGKERESKSEMDYFGARYYDHMRYRFISVDPEINKEKALSNPQYWNLYAYCGNNPITYLDSDGRDFAIAIEYGRGEGYGHLLLYFQNSQGNWNRYDMGPEAGTIPKAFNTVQAKSNVYETSDPKTKNGISETGSMMDFVYFRTSKEIDKKIFDSTLKSVDTHNSGKSKYQALIHNCKDAVVDLLNNAGGRFPKGLPIIDSAPKVWFKSLSSIIKNEGQ